MNQTTVKRSRSRGGEITINIASVASSFAENKDVAKDLREQQILPALQQGSAVVLDYSGVDTTTQSFTHALISEAIRIFGSEVLDSFSFKSCNANVKRIIGIVVEYMQGNMDSPIEDTGSARE